MKSENVENIWIRRSKFKESKISNDLSFLSEDLGKK